MTQDNLEEKLSDLTHLKYFVLCGYARNGVFLLIEALDWNGRAEVIIPAFTCSIIPKAISEAGAIPVLVDSEDAGLNIAPDKIEQAITSNTKAIYVIHTYGTAAKIEEICEIAKKHGLIVIEDLAHALFSQYKGRQLGTFGDFAVLSFTKKIINFEGGAIGTNNEIIYNKMLFLQRNLIRPLPFSLSYYFFDSIRLISSVWESRFSFLTMLLLKVLDFFYSIFFGRQSGLDINPTRFLMRDLARRISLRQLDALYSKTRDRSNNDNYLRLRKRFSDKIIFPELNQDSSDTLPSYFVGTARKNLFVRIFSGRTWINYNKPGVYPRADYLYSNCRIFAGITRFLKM